MGNRPFLLSFCLIGSMGAIAAACAGSSVTSDTDDTPTTSSQGGSTTTAVGGGGAGVGGSGGNTGPCGTDCSTINTPQCQVAQCNTQTGQCEVVNDEEGVACDDGTFCTISDACSAGTCVGGPQNDCGMAPPQCTEVTCDEGTQTCSSAPAMNGAACQDPNDLCLKGSTCSNGICIGGMQDDCFFFPVPECHVAVCNANNGTCEPQPGLEGNACNDPNDLCTVSKTCASGVCQGGQPKDCTQLTQGCVLGVCDVNSGQCVAQNLMNNDLCDDLDACTAGEICNNGQCTGGTLTTACSNGDGCCPNGCTINNDDDCQLCGNTTLEVGEELDPPPGPSTAVPLDTISCRYDFSAITQWYCNGTCGNWGGSASGCDQGDADVFCKLKMDNPNSTATTFGTGTAAAAPGVCCPPPTAQPGGLGCVSLGVLTSRGVALNVGVHDTSLSGTHGGGTVIMNLVCTNP
jgi:hypothetical protein